MNKKYSMSIRGSEEELARLKRAARIEAAKVIKENEKEDSSNGED